MNRKNFCPFLSSYIFWTFDVLVILDVERKLDEALMEGDFESIQEKVTPKTLTSCKTNALLKAFQVSRGL